MRTGIKITAVIPTCNRKQSLLRLLSSLNESGYLLHNLIIVDSGEDVLHAGDYQRFANLNIRYITITDRSVCIQRNIGIHLADSPWVFLCDDDLDVPREYLDRLVEHIQSHPEAGAVSGVVFQRKGGDWVGQYDVTSSLDLYVRFVFQLSIWGEIKVPSGNFIDRYLLKYYEKKGNHISKAGWPVITDFSGEFVRTPIYGLGASLVKKDWLTLSRYDEVLDSFGIGDNYGVAIGFPPAGIHLLKKAFVYHHRDADNRVRQTSQYYRRVLALDYFLKTRKELQAVRRIWFLWSLAGNILIFLYSRNIQMVRVAIKVFLTVWFGNNPYVEGKTLGGKIVSPST